MIGRDIQAGERACRIMECRWDGNLLRLKVDSVPAVGETLTIPVGGIADDPAVRFPASNVEPLPRGPVNAIPEGSYVTLPLLPEL